MFKFNLPCGTSSSLASIALRILYITCSTRRCYSAPPPWKIINNRRLPVILKPCYKNAHSLSNSIHPLLLLRDPSRPIAALVTLSQLERLIYLAGISSPLKNTTIHRGALVSPPGLGSSTPPSANLQEHPRPPNIQVGADVTCLRTAARPTQLSSMVRACGRSSWLFCSLVISVFGVGMAPGSSSRTMSAYTSRSRRRRHRVRVW
jgi:hypothetical protein